MYRRIFIRKVNPTLRCLKFGLHRKPLEGYKFFQCVVSLSVRVFSLKGLEYTFWLDRCMMALLPRDSHKEKRITTSKNKLLNPCK